MNCFKRYARKLNSAVAIHNFSHSHASNRMADKVTASRSTGVAFFQRSGIQANDVALRSTINISVVGSIGMADGRRAA